MMIPPEIVQPVVLQIAEETAAQINSYFNPVTIALFLGGIVVAMVMYYQWRWGKICSENVQILIVKSDGHGEYELAPQHGGSVSLQNKHNDSVRTWPINALSTIDVPYPGDGFVPRALQKTIRQVVVSEEDWEPLINRSPYKEKIASPDVIMFIQDLATKVQDIKPELALELVGLADELSPSPTREMIASPAVLGNLINEKITEAVITVNKETLDTLSRLTGKISSVLTVNVFYIGIAIVGVLTLVTLVLSIMGKGEMGQIIEDLELIKKSIGIVGSAP
jgi:hypothetical protein